MTLKMALQQFVCRFTLMSLLLCSGCHPANVTDNSTLVETLSPGTSPWLVYFYPYFRCVGSLITDQWVLSDDNCLSYSVDVIVAYVGLKNRTEGYSKAVRVTFDSMTCNRNEHICLLKLSSPVNFTDDIQAIPLSSNMSSVYNNPSSWVSEELSGKFGVLRTMKEIQATIICNDQCNCQKTFCVRVECGDSISCQNVNGSPLLIREGSQWVIAGVKVWSSFFLSSHWLQSWIHTVINGMEPTTVNPTDMPYKTIMPTTTIDITPTTPDDSIFSGGSNLILFAHVFSLSAG